MGKYDEYIKNPPKMRMTVNEDGRQVFNGLFVMPSLVDLDFKFGYQIVTKPFKGDNPPHTHNFEEFLAWYGTNPDDPLDFDAEIHLTMGEELEEHVITKPTIVHFPPGLVHCPLEIVRIGKPIVQIEIMLPPTDGTPGVRTPFFEEDAKVNPYDLVNMVWTPQE